MAEENGMFRKLWFYGLLRERFCSLDDFNGWNILKLYEMREGQDIPAAVRDFLKTRPDVQYCYDDGLSSPAHRSWLLREPTYVMVGSIAEVKSFCAANRELVSACVKENIHVIGGNYLSFWDCFDKTRNHISVNEYPGSADDAATYGDVILNKTADGTEIR